MGVFSFIIGVAGVTFCTYVYMYILNVQGQTLETSVYKILISTLCTIFIICTTPALAFILFPNVLLFYNIFGILITSTFTYKCWQKNQIHILYFKRMIT